jgi:hypothetical protein
MTKPPSLLDRLLGAPDVAAVVPRLDPDALHRVIRRFGLEDCAELVALASPRQLARVLDADVWRARTAGGDDRLDADRFGVWLDVLVQCGGDVAADKLAGIDIELVIAGLASHVSVCDQAAVASFVTLDGEQVDDRRRAGDAGCEIGGYVIEARRTVAWDAIVELLACLHDGRPEYFHRLMRGCVRMSNGARETDGLDDLLEDREQQMFDLGSEREARRDAQGYVAPAQARAFLQSARTVDVAAREPPRDPVSRAYFRALAPTPPETTAPDPSPDEALAGVVLEASAVLVEVLREAGAFSEPRRLLADPEAASPRLSLVRAHVRARASSAEALAYLVNAMLAGGSLQGRAFTPQQASDAVAATCNLGLERWPDRWGEADLVTAFQVGRSVLHREVCLYAAEGLAAALREISCSDREIRMQLIELRRELSRHLRDGTPWRARKALDVIMLLDPPCWAALIGMIDEWPVIHAAVGASRRSRRTIEIADFAFVSESRQIGAAHAFLAKLPSALTG